MLEYLATWKFKTNLIGVDLYAESKNKYYIQFYIRKVLWPKIKIVSADL